MVQMQVGQNDRVRREPPAAQESAEHPVRFACVQNDDLIPVPEKGSIRVADAELNILRGSVRQGKEGDYREGKTDAQHGSPDAPAPVKEAGSAQKQQAGTRTGDPVGSAGPEGDARKTAQRPHEGNEPLREQPSRKGGQPRKHRQRGKKQHRPVQKDQRRGQQTRRKIQQNRQQRKGLETGQLRQENAQLRSEKDSARVPEKNGKPAPGRTAAGQVRRDQHKTQHRAEGKLEGSD